MADFPIKDRRIVLVGGGGFIGHNLALEIKRRGGDVHVVDSLQVNNLGAITHNKDNIPNRDLYLALINERLGLLRQAGIPLRIQDARDYAVMNEIFDELQPQTIVHLAAIAHANRANKDPHSTFDHSLRTLENTLDYARNKVEHVIYLSSSMVYGNFDGAAVTEDSPCNPIGIYGALKFAGEKMCIAYNQVFGMNYTIIRPSALYGERCVSRRVGQVFIENAIQGLDLKVMGDGTDRLDFTYIGDLVDGLCRCIEMKAARNNVFNLTYGQGRSLMEMVDILKSEFPDVKVNYESRDSLMPERGTLSVQRARDVLGYNSSYPLERGLVQYIKWYRSMAEQQPGIMIRN